MKKDKCTFSEWRKWAERNNLHNLQYPGVYAIALSKKKIAGPFSFIKQIIYLGMTNSKKGLKNRLKQFDNGIRGKAGHGGATRVRHKHKDYKELTPKLFISVAPFKCDVSSNEPNDLRMMGRVADFEYCCLANYVEQNGELPEFNDKDRSPKK